jgi:hypothetical protein
VGFVVIDLKALEGRQSLSCGLIFEYRLSAHSKNLNHGRAKEHRHSEVSGTVASFGATQRAVEWISYKVGYVKAVSNQDADAQKQTLSVAGRLAATAGTSPTAGKEDSLFEAEVRDALTALGYTTVAQVGESGFRIDLAIVNSNPELGYILGIECDGKAYHSEWSARARDVWLQQILEKRGWKIHRIWSTNWWLDRDGEIRKLVAKIKSLGGS